VDESKKTRRGGIHRNDDKNIQQKPSKCWIDGDPRSKKEKREALEKRGIGAEVITSRFVVGLEDA